MIDPIPAGRAPSVLLVSHHDWLVLALGAVASRWGVTATRAATLAQAVHVADALDPDAVFVDVWMDRAGVAAGRDPVGRALRAAGAIGPVTPVLALSGGALSRAERLDALAQGAWDVVELPVDTDSLRLRLATWVAAKRHADLLKRGGVHDRVAPLYNLRGLLGRARELGADAARAGAPLCCVGIEFEAAGEDDAPITTRRADETRSGERLRTAWARTGRASDVVGRVGAQQFAILAPRTGEEGGRILADRLARSLGGEGGAPRTSVLALEPAGVGSADAVDLVGRTLALLRAAPPGVLLGR